MSDTGTGEKRRVGVLIHLPRPLIERLRADAERAGRSLSREIERLAQDRDTPPDEGERTGVA